MSYKRLLSAWERERESAEIQDIPDGFIREMKEYLEKLNKTPADPETLIGSITLKEKKYAAQMLQELVDRRVGKILMTELDGVPIDAKALTPEEQKLYSNIRQLIAGYKRGADLPDIEQAPHPSEQRVVDSPSREVIKPPSREEPEMIIVRFLQSLPAIMGIDMRAYGPFEKEDIASIPRENALNLIRRGIAKRVEIEP